MSRLGLLATLLHLACLPQLWAQAPSAAELPDHGGVAVSDGAAATEAQFSGQQRTTLRWEKRQPVPFREFVALHDALDEPLSSDGGKLARAPGEAEQLLADAKPGDTIRIQDGEYTDWGELEIDVDGEPGRPITIAPESQHGVAFRGDVTVKPA